MNRYCRPDIDTNHSLWYKSAGNYSSLPSLTKNIIADVAIIGGGFTGVSTAYYLSRRFPEKHIVLVEAKTLANGASGRNGGLMLNWMNTENEEEPELIQQIYHTTKNGIDTIENLIQTHSLPVRYRRQGCMQVFTNSRWAEEAHKEAEYFSQLGIPIEFLSGKRLQEKFGIEGVAGALFDATEGWLHGVEFLRALRPVLRSQGVSIYEHTPVFSIKEGKTIVLETIGGTIRSKALVLATNGYTPRLGYFRHGLFPLQSHMIATNPTSAEHRQSLGWGEIDGFNDDLERLTYGSLGPEGALMLGGGSNAAYDYFYDNRTRHISSSAKSRKSFASIENRLKQYFPNANHLQIAHRWSGTLGITMKRVCSMGVQGEYRNIYYALGYSGHGITLGNLAGKVLCDIYSDDDARWRNLPFYQNSLQTIPSEPFRWIGYHMYTRLTGRSPRF